ncbi:MAG: ABC transporter ATP-binding protein [Hyphomicrobiaceae bacterium]
MDGPCLEIWPSSRSTSTGFPASLFAAGTLSVQLGESLAILGPSGSGKTTLLGILAGLIPTDGWGQWPGQGAFARTALMVQNDGLLPWFSVSDNVTLGARLRGEAANQPRCDELLRDVGLDEVHNALPETLSGGMQQRAALARALYEDADLLLLDEPFSSLDAITRRQMQHLTRQATAGRTLVLVTHDPDEAWLMGDRIIVLEGRPARLCEVPKADSAVALWQRVLQTTPESESAPTPQPDRVRTSGMAQA